MPVARRSAWITVLAAVLPLAAAVCAAQPEPVAADLKRGQLLFIQCRACHDVQAGAAHKVGPNLHGFFGTPAGTTPGFAFSDALRQSKLVWNEDSLDRWMLRPTDVVPGTTMAFAGIASDRDRRALIAWLKVATRRQ